LGGVVDMSFLSAAETVDDEVEVGGRLDNWRFFGVMLRRHWWFGWFCAGAREARFASAGSSGWHRRAWRSPA
jgi:hypothetical protein